MAENLLPGRYAVGKASVDAGGTVVTPQGATWTDNVWVDDLFFLPSQPLVPPQRIESVNDDGEIVLAYPWPGAAAVEEPYEVRFVGIIERSTAQSRKVLEQLGDVKAWYDIIVEDDAARLALESASNPLPAGYRVLVRLDGVIWMKKTSTYGDWIGPVEFKGDTGNKGWSPAFGVVSDGERRVLQLTQWVGGEGTAPTGIGKYVGVAGLVDDIAQAIDVRGEGFQWGGAYNAASAYEKGSVTRQNGSSFIAAQAVPPGEAPSGAYPPVDTPYWAVLAAKGQDGEIDGVTPFWQSRILNDAGAAAAREGLGAVAKPASATADMLALFDGGPDLLKGVPWSALALGLTQKVKLFTASGTYIPDPKLIFGEVTCVSGGSGAGGVTGLSSFIFMSGGGSTGGISRKFFTPAMVGASQPVTVGAKGIGGTGNNNGGAGGNSSLGTLCVALGPPGSPYSTAGSAGVGAPGGGLGTGDIRATGASGDGAEAGAVTPNTNYISGKGADGPFGTGGRSRVGAANSSGEDASGYGAGGGGAVVVNSTATAKGGDGSPGLVIVIEWCWGN